MNQTADVIIVGGGVTGLLTAIHLKVLGVDKVTVLERYHVGSGQSHRAAGIVRALVRHPLVARALAESIAFVKDFEQRFDDPILYHPSGYLLLTDLEQADAVNDSISAAAKAGCEARQIDAVEAQELQRGLREDDETLYVYEPGAIHLDPMPAVQAMARVAKRLGVKVIEGCEVGDILTHGGKVTGIESAQGRFEAPTTLIATSVWGAAQLARLGIEVPVYPHRAEMAFFHVPTTDDFRLSRIVSDTRSMLYLRPEGDRQMFVGWREGDRVHGVDDMDDEEPDHYKQTADFERLAAMQRRLAVTLPPMDNGFVHRTYACVYDYTPDGMPVLDRADSVDGLYFALGFSGGGFSISPWVGRSMAQFIVDRKTPSQIEPFELKRFAEGKLIRWANVGKSASTEVDSD